jgi:hypothetical protein
LGYKNTTSLDISRTFKKYQKRKKLCLQINITAKEDSRDILLMVNKEVKAHPKDTLLIINPLKADILKLTHHNMVNNPLTANNPHMVNLNLNIPSNHIRPVLLHTNLLTINVVHRIPHTAHKVNIQVNNLVPQEKPKIED